MEVSEKKLQSAIRKVMTEVLRPKNGEKILIIGNPTVSSERVSKAFHREAVKVGARAELLWQESRTMAEPMDENVRKAISRVPDLVIAASEKSLGHDAVGRTRPYVGDKGERFNNILYFLRAQKKLRAFWFPLPSLERFVETVSVDYNKMGRLSLAVKKRIDRAEKVRIRTKYGTDLVLVKNDRQARCNFDGDAHRPGSGGNLPMGEVYVTPIAGASHQGDIVIDVSLFIEGKTYLVATEPIYIKAEKGFVTDIRGKKVAGILKRVIKWAEVHPIKLLEQRKMTKILAKVNSRNARNIGEVAVGVNPKAKIVGDLIEDEKVYGTAHIAIGAGQYDGDPAFIHIDCVVSRPEVILIYPNGKEEIILKDRRFQFSY